MKRNLILLLFLLIMFAPSIYGSNSENYVGRCLGEALADFCKKNPGLKISFIYDELEDYKVKESPKSDDAMQALRSLVAMNPVSITVEGDEIYIEARQKGKYKYGGRTVDDLTGEPVSYATVLLQNPKDTTTITYGITDENGYFSIPCDRKNVQVRFSSVGYHTLYLKSAPKDMGKVRLRRQTMKLGEMTKTADSRYAMTDRTVYLPTQREKKAAQDGLSLLRFMGIPSLIVSMDGSSISTLSGDGVAVFIDYERAGATEIQGLLPEDVKKVEVLDYPSDPRFEGVSHAVNFIMAKYEYGGYVKPAINQCLDFDYGYYSLSAKYTKGKMAYDIYTGFDHFDSDKECKESDETYDFGSYDLKKTDKCIDSFVESDEAYLSGRIKYTGDKTTVSNQLAIRYDYSPTVRNVGMNTYQPALYPDGESFQNMKSNSLIPSWRGNYTISLPSKFTLIVNTSLIFSRNYRNTYFKEDGTEILRDVNEKVWNGFMGVSISKEFGKHSVTLSLNGELQDDRLSYVGDNPAEVHDNDKSAGGRLAGSFNFGKLRIQPSVKFYYQWTLFDGTRYRQGLPGYYISGSYNFNKRHQLSFDSEMSNWTIGVSNRSPNIVVQNNLNAVKGDPSLKCWLYNSASIDYTYFPVSWLSLGAYGSYQRHTKPMEFLYMPTEIDGREMMLRTYIKDGYFQIISEGVSAVSRLLDNTLNLGLTATVTSYRKGGRNPFSTTALNGSLSGTYYFGNFYARAAYELSQRSSSQSEKLYVRPSYYTLSFGFNIRSWKIEASARNVFRSDYKKGYSCMEFSNYQSETNYYGTAYRRKFWIKATYTVKYGKKVKEDRIDRGSSAVSGIVE